MHLRTGGTDDVPALLRMMDGAVAWLAAQGRTGQWGTEPYSVRAGAARKMTERVSRHTLWIAELDGEPAGALILAAEPMPYVEAADEPERYVQLLVTDRRWAGRAVGSTLLDLAAAQTRRAGVGLLRVNCYAGYDGLLVRYYRDQGFTPVGTFTVEKWPGQLLARRLDGPTVDGAPTAR